MIEIPPIIIRDAVISPCANYRYILRRIWNEAKKPTVFMMLNPSTADGTLDDPTIRRCLGYAANWYTGGLVVVNLFAYRTTNPAFLKRTFDPIGPENDEHIFLAARQAEFVVCGYGTMGSLFFRGRKIVGRLRAAGIETKCLARNKDGSPAHPLYQRSDSWPIDFAL